MLRPFLASSLLAVLLFACGSETTTPSSSADFVTEAPQATRTKAAPAAPDLAPPPPACLYLTEATVLSFFPRGVRMPMPAHRAVDAYNTCQYDLSGEGWSAALVLEMPEEGERQSIVDEVAGGVGNERVRLGEAKGRYSNGGRILSVAGNKHFRLKFSALAEEGKTGPFDEAGREGLLARMAMHVLSV